jgi:uncharacterized membrane protein
MKKIMWIISFISLAGTTIVLQFMPDSVPMHYDMAGNIDRWGSKYENLIAPIIIMVMSLFWTIFIRYFEKKALKTHDEKESAGAKSNAKVISIVGLCMAAMFTVLQGFMLYGAYYEAVSEATAWTVDIGKVSVILMGIIFIILGNFMTKTRINSAVGVRVSWSMYNDTTWRKSNRFGAFAIMIAGVLTIISAAVMKNSFGAAMISLGYIIIASIITVGYAHKVYKDELATESKN